MYKRKTTHNYMRREKDNLLAQKAHCPRCKAVLDFETDTLGRLKEFCTRCEYTSLVISQHSIVALEQATSSLPQDEQ